MYPDIRLSDINYPDNHLDTNMASFPVKWVHRRGTEVK